MNKSIKKNGLNRTAGNVMAIFAFILFALMAVFTPLTGLGTVNAEGAATPRVSDEEKDTFENPANPFVFSSFNTMYDGDELKIYDLSKLTVDSDENGLQIKGKNKAVGKSSITIRKLYDFGTVPQTASSGKRTNRIRIDAVAKYHTNTTLRFYIDENPEPFLEKRIPTQPEKDDWSCKDPVFAEVPNDIYGLHYITIEIYDKTTAEDKNTSVLLRDIKFYKESVPTVYVEIDEALGTIEAMNSDGQHKTNCYGKIRIRIPDGYQSPYGKAATYEKINKDTAGYHDLEYIRGRGNSTWDVTKKPYKLKLDAKTDLFGMGENKHWALIANYYDNSLIRNRITYYMGDLMDLAYTPKLVPVDVVMNDEYLGSYYLSEVVRVDDTRVEIDDMEDLTLADTEDNEEWKSGGYLLGMSPYGKEEGYQFTSDAGVTFVLESPEEIEGLPEEKINEINKYIKNYINKTEEAIYSDDFADNDDKPLEEYLDLDSAAKYYLFQMFTHNGDAYITASTKLYKKKNGLLYFGPLWDFDYVAWGSGDYYTRQESLLDAGVRFDWFERLKSNPEFVAKVKEAWYGTGVNDPKSMKYILNDMIRDGGLIDSYRDELSLSADNNFDKANITCFPFGPHVENPNGYITGYIADVDDNTYIVCNNYSEEIDRLKTWISKRIVWVDKYMKGFENDSHVSLVNFYDGDELVCTYNLRYGGPIKKFPELEPREGYYFLGWYGTGHDYDPETDESIEIIKKFSAGEYLDDEVVNLYAKWEKVEDVNAPKEICFERDEMSVATDSQCWVYYSLIPLDAEGGVEFESSDPELAIVYDDGSVFSRGKPGTVTITATTINGLKAECVIHIVNDLYGKYPYEIGFDKEDITLEIGEAEKINIVCDPYDAKPLDKKLRSENPKVAYMTDAGVIVAVGRGETNIFMELSDAFSETETSIHVTVTDSEAEKAEAEKAEKEKAAKEAEEAARIAESKKKDDEIKSKTDELSKKNDELSKKSEELAKKNEEIKSKDAQLAKTESEKNAALTNSNLIIKKDTEFTYKKIRYTVTKACKFVDGKLTTGEVGVSGCTKSFAKKGKSFKTPDTVVMNGNTYVVTSVGEEAFKNCKKLKTVNLGPEIKKIDANAFSGCSKLKKITINNEDMVFGAGAFKGLSSKAKVYVPDIDLNSMKSRLSRAGIKSEQVKSF